MHSSADLQSPLIPPSALKLLACPACSGALHEEQQGLVCKACGRVYPVRDGIPALIAERAR